MMAGEKGKGILLANASAIANVSMQFVSKLISSRISSHHQSAQPVTSRTPQNKTNMGEYEARNTTSLENISVLV